MVGKTATSSEIGYGKTSENGAWQERVCLILKFIKTVQQTAFALLSFG